VNISPVQRGFLLDTFLTISDKIDAYHRKKQTLTLS